MWGWTRRGKESFIDWKRRCRPEENQIKREAIMNAREISIVFNKLNLSEEFSGSLTLASLPAVPPPHHSDSSDELHFHYQKSINFLCFVIAFTQLTTVSFSPLNAVRRCEESRPFERNYVHVKIFQFKSLPFDQSEFESLVNVHFHFPRSSGCERKNFFHFPHR